MAVHSGSVFLSQYDSGDKVNRHLQSTMVLSVTLGVFNSDVESINGYFDFQCTANQVGP